MEKLKQVLSSNKDTDKGASTESTTGATGKISGPGSHFPKYDSLVGSTQRSESAYVPGTDATTGHSALGSTTTGTESSTVGTTGTQAAAAQQTAGPEGLTGGTHVGTTSESTTYPSSGLAYIGGVGAAAGAGAGVATTTGLSSQTRTSDDTKDHVSGGYPAPATNPYRAVTLDSRVDSPPSGTTNTGSLGQDSTNYKPTTTGSEATTTAGVAAASSASTHDTKSHETTVPAPSTLTTTVDPADRSAEYSESAATKVPETTTSTKAAGAEDTFTGVIGSVLGAIGLGSFASGITGTDKGTSAVADDSSVPSQPRQPPSHHRKESIPTTAYPAGPKSVSPIAPPVGGTRESISERHEPQGQRSQTSATTQESSATHQPTVGAVAATTGAASTAVGGATYKESKAIREGISGEPTGSPSAVGSTATTTTTPPAVSKSYVDDSKDLRQGITAPTSTSATTTGATPTATNTLDTTRDTTSTTTAQKGEDHTGRNAAIGAGVVGAGATAATGAHEYSKRDAEQQDREAAKAEAARIKEAEHEKARLEKEQEKQHKEAEKAAAKEEKAHQKEIEKGEKHKQKEMQKEAEREEKRKEKELEKAETQRRKSIAKEEKEQQKQAEKEEKERQKQLEKEQKEKEKREAAAATAAGVGAGTAATATTQDRPLDTSVDKSKDESATPKEKKPSIFKRIFKRRKNKDTGADEDYSTDEEDPITGERRRSSIGRRRSSATPAVGSTAAAAASTTGTSKYEVASGGMQKPSYNPFSKAKPPTTLSDSPAGTTGTSSKVVQDPSTTSTLGATGSSTTANPISPTTKANEPWTRDDTTGGLSRESATVKSSTDPVGSGVPRTDEPSVSSTTAKHTGIPGSSTTADKSITPAGPTGTDPDNRRSSAAPSYGAQLAEPSTDAQDPPETVGIGFKLKEAAKGLGYGNPY